MFPANPAIKAVRRLPVQAHASGQLASGELQSGTPIQRNSLPVDLICYRGRPKRSSLWRRRHAAKGIVCFTSKGIKGKFLALYNSGWHAVNRARGKDRQDCSPTSAPAEFPMKVASFGFYWNKLKDAIYGATLHLFETNQGPLLAPSRRPHMPPIPETCLTFSKREQ